MVGMIRQARMTIGRKIYALICLSFVGLLGITFLGSRELASSLTPAETDRTAAPRRSSPRHRQGGACRGAEGRRFGRRRAEARDGAGRGASLRQQRLLLDQRHASENGDASDQARNERQRSLEPTRTRTASCCSSISSTPSGRAVRASFPTSGPSRASKSPSRNCPMWSALRRGTGSSAPASTSTT